MQQIYLRNLFWNYSEEKFVKKSLKLDTRNSDPQYLREQIREAFPELSADGEVGSTYKLWQVRGNQTELTALPVDVNNAQALFSSEELNRSCVYIKADVSYDVSSCIHGIFRDPC